MFNDTNIMYREFWCISFKVGIVQLMVDMLKVIKLKTGGALIYGINMKDILELAKNLYLSAITDKIVHGILCVDTILKSIDKLYVCFQFSFQVYQK